MAAFRAMIALKAGESHVAVFSSEDEAKLFAYLLRKIMEEFDGK